MSRTFATVSISEKRRCDESKSKYVRFFDEFGIEDVPSVGGKNASLGEMYQKLSTQGVRVPNGFAITATPTDTCSKGSGASLRSHERSMVLWRAT